MEIELDYWELDQVHAVEAANMMDVELDYYEPDIESIKTNADGSGERIVKSERRVRYPVSMNKDKCIEESRRFSGLGRWAFQRGCRSAYWFAHDNGMLDQMPWLGRKLNPFRDKTFVVYRYVFAELNAAYVGLTCQPKERDRAHHGADFTKPSSVYYFSVANGTDVPEMEIVHGGLSAEDAQRLEHEEKLRCIWLGYDIINRGKTGCGCGAIGGSRRKWTATSIMEHMAGVGRKYRSGHWMENHRLGGLYRASVRLGLVGEVTSSPRKLKQR